MLGPEIHRQATRNAAIVLEVAAVLLAKPETQWSITEATIAHIMHEKETT